MNRPLEALRGATTATRERTSAVSSQSERTLLLGAILLGSAVSAVTIYVLTQLYSVDALSTLLLVPQDCWLDWGMNIGRHCFSDYAMVATMGKGPHPWDAPIALPPTYQLTPVGFPAAGRIPHMLFGLPAYWLGSPRLGLIAYLFAMTVAVLSPAVWAARGATGLERVVIFVALGAAAVPVWEVIDRGNSAGFVVPIALVYLIALSRQRWGLVTLMVILAAVVKPQFVIFGVVLLVARKWRWAGIGIAGVVISNIAAFLLWPGFPGTITDSVVKISQFNSGYSGLQDPRNVSFARALLLIPDTLKTQQSGKIPDDYLLGPRTMIGFVVLIVVVVSLLILGQRIPPVMTGIVLLATGSLFPSYVSYYYLVFALPVAALIVRNPNGPEGVGLFDRIAALGDRRRAVGICVSLAVALTLVQIALPGQPFTVQIYGQFGAKGVVGSTQLVPTTVGWAPFLWLIACAAIIFSYARRPTEVREDDNGSAPDDGRSLAIATTTSESAPHDSTPKKPA